MNISELNKQINIQVKTEYLQEQSDPNGERYVFSYQITINNHSNQQVQLLSRYWLINDGNEKSQEIEGRGVVGEQPVIEPASSYSYTSGTVLPTQVGSMQGHYGMSTEDGQKFDANIPTFTLATPNALH